MDTFFTDHAHSTYKRWHVSSKAQALTRCHLSPDQHVQRFAWHNLRSYLVLIRGKFSTCKGWCSARCNNQFCIFFLPISLAYEHFSEKCVDIFLYNEFSCSANCHSNSCMFVLQYVVLVTHPKQWIWGWVRLKSTCYLEFQSNFLTWKNRYLKEVQLKWAPAGGMVVEWHKMHLVMSFHVCIEAQN